MRSNHVGRTRTTPAQRVQWVRRYQRSNLSQAAFARQHGLGLSTLGKWLREVRSAKSSGPRLQEVSLGAVLGTASWVAEVAAGGVTVRLTAEAPPQWLPILLRRLPC